MQGRTRISGGLSRTLLLVCLKANYMNVSDSIPVLGAIIIWIIGLEVLPLNHPGCYSSFPHHRIDSLCIVQDSSKDWVYESSRMRSV